MRVRRQRRGAVRSRPSAACAAMALALAPAASRARREGDRVCFGAAALRPAPYRCCRNMTRVRRPGRSRPSGTRAPCEPRPEQARHALRVRRLAVEGGAARRAARRQPRDELARRAWSTVARDRRWRALLDQHARLPVLGRGGEAARRAARAVHALVFARCGRGLRDHPEVSTVFVSHNALAPTRAGRRRALRRRHALRAGRAPGRRCRRSVKKVVVLRDAPDPADDTLRCLRRVLAAGTQRPGPACATPRADAVRWDSAVSAAVEPALPSATASSTSRASSAAGAAATPSSAACASTTTCLGHFTTAVLADARAVPAARGAPAHRRLVAPAPGRTRGRAGPWRGGVRSPSGCEVPTGYGPCHEPDRSRTPQAAYCIARSL